MEEHLMKKAERYVDSYKKKKRENITTQSTLEDYEKDFEEFLYSKVNKDDRRQHSSISDYILQLKDNILVRIILLFLLSCVLRFGVENIL
jgi:hypothetical protein